MSWIQDWQNLTKAEQDRAAAKDIEREEQNKKPLSNPLPDLEIPNTGRTTGNRSQWRTHTSQAMACHPSQVKEFQAHADHAGLTGVRYSKTGEVHISSAGQLKGLCKIRNMVNNDGVS